MNTMQWDVEGMLTDYYEMKQIFSSSLHTINLESIQSYIDTCPGGNVIKTGRVT